MTVSESKLKLLLLWDLLKEKTDEDHSLTTGKICQELHDRYGISSERKSIYNDIDTINAFYDYKYINEQASEEIVKERGNGTNKGYHIEGRYFEPSEIKILVNLLRSARGISALLEKTIIDKLCVLVSNHAADEIKKESVFFRRPKTPEQTLFYNIEWIEEAIKKDFKIEFQYLHWTIQGDLEPRHNGKRYLVSPWKIVWSDAYYLLAYDSEKSMMKTYRIDKISKLRITAESRIGRESYTEIDFIDYTSRRIAMYGGREETLTIRCKKELIDVFFDYFGKESLMVIKENDEYIRIRMIMQVSPPFFGWIASLGNSVEILQPVVVRQEYMQYLNEIIGMY